jgi:phosphatidylinositol alpha-1,6-mannosyltransferase
MKILFTTSTLPLKKNDSILSSIIDIAKSINANTDSKVVILAPHYHGTKTEEIIDNVKIIRFRYFFGPLETLCYGYGISNNLKNNKANYLLLPFFFFFQIMAIRKIVKKEKIDIINAHWLVPQGLSAVIYKKIFSPYLPIICTMHGTDAFGLQSRFWKKIKKFIVLNINHLIVISEKIKSVIINMSPDINSDKISVIHYGIDNKIFNPNINTKNLKEKYKIKSFCLFSAGRLVISKGYLHTIEAMKKIVEVFPETKLLIAGQGPDLEIINNKIKSLKLENSIIMLGPVPKHIMPEYYNLADIFIGATINIPGVSAEGFGLVYSEALACGTPVIATDIGGVLDVVNEKTGILIPDKSTAAIQEAVITLLTSPDKIEKFKQGGLEQANTKFNWKNIANKYIQIYINACHN